MRGAVGEIVRPHGVMTHFEKKSTYKLFCEWWDVLDYRESDAPLLILGQLNDGRDQVLRELVQSNNFSNLTKLVRKALVTPHRT